MDQKSPLQAALATTHPAPPVLQQPEAAAALPPLRDCHRTTGDKNISAKLNLISPRLPSWQLSYSSSIILPFKGRAPRSVPCPRVLGFYPISILKGVMEFWGAEQPQGSCTSQRVIAGFNTCIWDFNPHRTTSLLGSSALGRFFGFNASCFDGEDCRNFPCLDEAFSMVPPCTGAGTGFWGLHPAVCTSIDRVRVHERPSTKPSSSQELC